MKKEEAATLLSVKGLVKEACSNDVVVLHAAGDNALSFAGKHDFFVSSVSFLFVFGGLLRFSLIKLYFSLSLLLYTPSLYKYSMDSLNY